MPTPRNRTVIVTGASSGIGRMIARRMGQEGANVVLAARSAAQLETLRAEIAASGGVALPVPTDVTSDADVQRLVAAALAEFGGVDVLINNAGYGVFAPLAEAEMRDIEGMMSVNYLGAVRCIQAVLPLMRKQQSGHIVNLASVAGLVSTPNMSAYSASKYAMVAMSQALQVELARSPITCSLICPGPVNTPFFKRADFNKMSWFARAMGMLEPEQVADVVVEAVRTRPTIRTIPRPFYLLALASKLMPAWTRRVLDWVG